MSRSYPCDGMSARWTSAATPRIHQTRTGVCLLVLGVLSASTAFSIMTSTMGEVARPCPRNAVDEKCCQDSDHEEQPLPCSRPVLDAYFVGTCWHRDPDHPR